ncbi:hypothetical protein YC2023_032770 [Brassica napus]
MLSLWLEQKSYCFHYSGSTMKIIENPTKPKRVTYTNQSAQRHVARKAPISLMTWTQEERDKATLLSLKGFGYSGALMKLHSNGGLHLPHSHHYQNLPRFSLFSGSGKLLF